MINVLVRLQYVLQSLLNVFLKLWMSNLLYFDLHEILLVNFFVYLSHKGCKFLILFDLFISCDDLFYIFEKYSGFLCYVKGNGPFMCKGQNVIMFAWFTTYFIKLLSKTNAIDFDTKFKVLNPYKTCIPQMIINNTGAPIGIIGGPSEDLYLYSIIFQSLLQIDLTKKFFQLFRKKNYVADEHPCFDLLAKKYNLDICKCFTHLIHSVWSELCSSSFASGYIILLH